MKWNWQHRDWPHFRCRAQELGQYEKLFWEKAGVSFGALKYFDAEQKTSLIVDMMEVEAFRSSEIEGEILNRESLQSSIRAHFGLKTGIKRVPPAERGMAEMMVSVYQTWDEPLTHEMLFSWHKMVVNGRHDLDTVGAYRTHDGAMEIVSGPIHAPKIHFEAPPSAKVPGEMNDYVTWFNGFRGDEHGNPLIRAGLAHLYFESIHPFEDGNGRIGRAIAEKALSQSIGRPTLIAVANTIGSRKKDYYDALQRGSYGMDATEWLHYFAQTVLAAQDYTQAMIDFLISKGRFFLRFADRINPRQEKVLHKMFSAGIEGFKGGLSADNYIRMTKTSRATATRDLNALVEMGALTKTGVLRHSRYWLKLPQSG